MAEPITDKQRAIRAEKQVERLERELELIKSRLKVEKCLKPLQCTTHT